MVRPLRIQFPGAVYHVISRGNERKPIVRDDDDREKRLTDPNGTEVLLVNDGLIDVRNH